MEASAPAEEEVLSSRPPTFDASLIRFIGFECLSDGLLLPAQVPGGAALGSPEPEVT